MVTLQEAGIAIAQPGLAVDWRPSAEDRAHAVAFGRAFGEQVLKAGPPPAS